MFEIRSSYNSQSSVHFESQQQNVRTMLFIPREIWERALLHNTAIVNCLWVKQKVLLAEVFIVYERATTKKLLFNRRNGYPQTYLYYYYLPPIKVLRIKLLLSWFPVYYPVTKNVRVSWKNLEQRKGPRKKNANFTQNSPLMANLLLLLPEKRGYFYRSPFLGVRSNRIEKCQFGKWWYSSLLYYQLTTNYYLTPKQKRG